MTLPLVALVLDRFIVLPHWNVIPLAQVMTPYLISVSWMWSATFKSNHWFDQMNKSLYRSSSRLLKVELAWRSDSVMACHATTRGLNPGGSSVKNQASRPS